MTFAELKQSMEEIRKQIGQLTYKTGWDKWEEFNLEDEPTDPEDKYLMDEYYWMMDKLFAVESELDYLRKPVTLEGVLHKNEQGRYEANGREFTSGNSLEAYVFDTVNEEYHWIHSRIEHDGEDYYIVDYSGSIEGVKVRLRR